MQMFLSLLLLVAGLSAYAEKPYELAICSIFKNEAPYLKEWIEFHKLQGVQHFYLYDNCSDDNFLEVLQPYVDSKLLTLTDWPYMHAPGNLAEWARVQIASYDHCIKTYGDECSWIAIIDIDEFLYCPTGEPLPSFLGNYKEYGGICVNWLLFGTSGVEEIPENKLMIEVLDHCILKKRKDSEVKSIVQPKYVKSCSIHLCKYKDGKYAVNSKFKKVVTHNSRATVEFEEIRINHYWSRTEKYFREKKIPRRFDMRTDYSIEELLNQVKQTNESVDDAIQQYVPALRAAMGKNNI